MMDNIYMISITKEKSRVLILSYYDKWILNDSTQPISLRFPCLFSCIIDENFSAMEVCTLDTKLPCSIFLYPEKCMMINCHSKIIC